MTSASFHPQPTASVRHSGHRRVRALCEFHVSLLGTGLLIVEADQEVELPGHIWPSVVGAGKAQLLGEPEGAPAPVVASSAAPGAIGAQPAAEQSPPRVGFGEDEDEAAQVTAAPEEPEELPAPRRQRRLVSRGVQ